MAIVACPECGKEVSTEASVCPHCGAPSEKTSQEERSKKNIEAFSGLIGLVAMGAAVYFFWPLFSPFLSDIGLIPPKAPHATQMGIAPMAVASDDLATIIAATGCSSPYSDDKKQDIFNRQYKDHLVRAAGEVVRLDKSSLGLRVARTSLTQDVEIHLKDPAAGYNLTKNTRIGVVFRLQHLGGCVLPYGGDLGEIR